MARFDRVRDEVNSKVLLANFLETEANYEDEYVKAATAALKREGFERIVLFTFNDMLVMINMNASPQSISSGLILDDSKKKIVGFKNSDDKKSVSTESLTRHMIMDSISNENDVLRLKTLSKDKQSWVIHITNNEIFEKGNVAREYWFPPNLCNIHTHGLDAYAHKDFQVVLDIGHESASFLLNKLAERVRDGEVFTDGERVSGVYVDCEIKLVETKEGYRNVLRVLIPDENDRFPDDEGCAYPYNQQTRVVEQAGSSKGWFF